MGVIVDANEDHDQADDYLLVVDGVVTDAIYASYNFCNNNILSNYDYLVDITVGGQLMAGIGWSYDPGEDTFSPPPEDFAAELEAALLEVDTAIEAAAEAYMAASPEDRSTVIGNVLGELSGESQDEQDLMTAVAVYLQGLEE